MTSAHPLISNTSLSDRHPGMVSVIIPSFGRIGPLYRCVESVRASTPQPPGGLEVIVITSSYSGPETASIEAIGATVVRRVGTVWVSDARNTGAALATGEYLLFLDDDNVIAPDAIWHLYSAFIHWPETSVAGPVMYYGSTPTKIWCAGVRRSRVFMKTHLNTTLPSPIPARLESEDFPNCFMVRGADFQSVSGFDARGFPQHMEESDLARRILAMKGGRVYCVPAAKYWHFIGTSFARRLHMHDDRWAFWNARNRTLFVAMYGDRVQWLAHVAIGQWALACVYIGVAVIQSPDGAAVTAAYIRGMFEGLKLGIRARHTSRLGQRALFI